MGHKDVPQAQPRVLGVALASLEISGTGASGTRRDPSPSLNTFEFKTAVIEHLRTAVIDDVRKDLVPTSGRARYFAEGLGGEVSLEMVEVPGGSFRMGSPATEPHRGTCEGPQTQVEVRSFFMGKYPVTQAQWRAVAMMPQKRRRLPLDPSALAKGDNQPVIRVSWDDAVEFCSRLTEHTGRDYRLPTEAEWEYACRAGTETAFAFGNELPVELANYGWHYLGQDRKYRVRLVDVGAMGVANRFGLYDMHGNVYEWCLDIWKENYEAAFVDGSTEGYASNVKYRVCRGGSWQNKDNACRSAHRSAARRWLRNDITGFRVAMQMERGN